MKKRFFSLLLALLCLCPLLPAAVFAAPSAKASIRLSSSKVTVGSKVTVTVTYQSASDIGSYDFLLNYDANLLQYESGADSETGNGKLPFVNYNENSNLKTVERSVVFKALATGTAKFSTQAKYIVDNESFSPMSVTEASKSLTVDPKQTASTNNNLKSLSVSGGDLNPAFSSSQTKYTMEVDYSVKKLTVSAVAEHNKAKVSVSQTDLALGENTVKITVTAESGAKKTYTLTVTRKQSAFANVSAQVDQIVYQFAHDPDTLTPPPGFAATSASYDGKQVLAYKNEDGFFTLVWLVPTESAPPASSATGEEALPPVTSDTSAVAPREGWYMLLSDGLTLLPYVSLSSSPAQYVPIPLPSETAVPEGCQGEYVTIGDQTVWAYRNEYCKSNGLYLIYARCSNNTSAFFYWHQESGSFSPYVRPETVTVTLTVPPVSSEQEAGATVTSPEHEKKTPNLLLTVYSFAVTGAFAVLLLVFLLWARKKSAQTKELSERLETATRRKRPARDPASHFVKEEEIPKEPVLPEKAHEESTDE